MGVALFDLDCFYAQVEIVNNPSLENKPVGIKQRSLMVTCNYIAREMGVSKTMSLREAKEICPSLVIIDGSNLDKYREASYNVFKYLQQFGTVEKGGMDEFFVEILNIPKYAQKDENGCHYYGDVYGDLLDTSMYINYIRKSLLKDLRFTSSAGISTCKLFAKLCAGLHKPFQQTTMSIEYANTYINTVDVKHIPGFGYASREKLNISNPMTTLEFTAKYQKIDIVKLLGDRYARIYDLMCGIDDSKVISSSLESVQISVENIVSLSSMSNSLNKITKHLLQLIKDKEFTGNICKRWPKTLRILFGTNTWKRKSKSLPWPLKENEVELYKKLTAVIIKTIKPLLDKNINAWSINIAATNFEEILNKKSTMLTYYANKNTIKVENESEYYCTACDLNLPAFAKSAHLNFHKNS